MQIAASDGKRHFAPVLSGRSLHHEAFHAGHDLSEAAVVERPDQDAAGVGAAGLRPLTEGRREVAAVACHQHPTLAGRQGHHVRVIKPLERRLGGERPHVVPGRPEGLADPAGHSSRSTREVEYTEDALARMLERAEGYPYFLQEWGRGVWDSAVANPIDVEDVAAAAPEVEQKLAHDFFSVRLERATAAKRRYCRAMASLGDGAQKSAAIADALGYSSVRAASTQRASLIEKGGIYSVGRGRLDFTVPRFAAFLREMPEAD